MADEAVRLYRLAMDAYADGDANLAGALDDMDDRLDQLHKDYIQAILELHADVRDVQAAVQLALVGPLLRADRRPRRQHRRAGAVHGHRLAARAHRRGAAAAGEPGVMRTRRSLAVVALVRAGRRPSRSSSSVRSGSRAACWPPAGACRDDVVPSGTGPRRGHLGGRARRSTARCCGAARGRSPRRGWRARWR